MEIEKYDVFDDVGNGIYSFFKSGVNIIYNKSNMDVFKSFYDSFIYERWLYRFGYAVRNYNQLNDRQKSNFFSDLPSNPQNMNYLYEFFEKIRTSTYELQAKLLARLIVELVKNKGLTYFESNLLANITTLNDQDIKIIYYFLKENESQSSGKKVTFKFINFSYLSTYNKSLQLGIVDGIGAGFIYETHEDKRDEPEMKICYLTPYSHELFILLDDILQDEEIDI